MIWLAYNLHMNGHTTISFQRGKNARKGRNVLSIEPKVSLATQRDSNIIVEVLALAK